MGSPRGKLQNFFVAGTMAICKCISSFRLTEEYIDEASLQGWNPDDLRISKLKRCFIGGEKEQNFQELGRKKSFTRPDCR